MSDRREKIRKAIRDQGQKIAVDKAQWLLLTKLAEGESRECLAVFYETYADYLDMNEVVSERREMLIRVFRRTAAVLRT